MVIEWLKVRVDPEAREDYIQKDAEIWTATLASYPGFLGKEVWLNPNAADEVVLVIRWETRQQWKSIPQAVLDATEQRFQAVLGNYTHEIVESSEYQVRKFPAPPH